MVLYRNGGYMNTKEQVIELLNQAKILIEKDPIIDLDNSEILDSKLNFEKKMELIEERSSLRTVLFSLNNLDKYL